MSRVDSAQLFVLLRKHFPDRENCPENFLTDCFAAALQEDQALARELVQTIASSDRVDTLAISDSRIDVFTRGIEEPGSIPDMVLEVVGGSARVRIGVEVKLDSPESVGQLGRYVRLKQLWAMTAITVRPVRSTSAELAAGTARWLAPPGRLYFTWTDLYPIIEEHAKSPDAPVLTRALLCLFQNLRFQPPHPEVGTLGRGGTDVERKARGAFFQNWTATEQVLRNRGWTKMHPGKNAQLYFKERSENAGGLISQGILSPLADEGRTLRMKLRYHVAESRDSARRKLEASVGTLPAYGRYVTLKSTTGTRAEGLTCFLDVDVPMTRILPVDANNEVRSDTLARYVDAMLSLAD